MHINYAGGCLLQNKKAFNLPPPLKESTELQAFDFCRICNTCK